MTVIVRAAADADVEAICVIHNQGIVDRTATLDQALKTPSERRQWLAQRETRHPVIVAERDGEVVGWGSLNRFNPRDAYDHVADFSVYIERRSRGQGLGTMLLAHLVDLARAIGYHKMALAALVGNDAGVALYIGAGFSRVGIYREQGQLDGRWVDVLIMEKIL
jgi:L-amino acid N-acyltransferase YncA